MKKVNIIGIGMNGTETLTAEASKAIENADIIIGAERMTAPFIDKNIPVFNSYKAAEIADIINKSSCENAAVLMSGDCGFYSGAEGLLPLLNDCDVNVISGISSPVYFCSRLKMKWSDMHFVSLHGSDGNIVRSVRSHRKVFFLLGGKTSPKNICQRLCEYNMGDIPVYIGENLGYENERIFSGRAADFTDTEIASLSVMITVNDSYEGSVRTCIPDEEFIRGKVPMTKAEVRCIAVSKLDINTHSICWDIGGGTGSVSVEMALRCENGRVYSVEKNTDAARLIEQNKIKFGCDNIEIICGNAEEEIERLPAPDKVFIGGSGGHLCEIIGCVYSKNPAATIVVTAVSLETLNEAVCAFEKCGITNEISQLAVTRTKKLGSHTMLAAENPIFIIRGLDK